MSGDLDWLEKRQRVLSLAPFDRQWSVAETESILDYLHGDIAGDEVKACCHYEYARASETLRKGRREYNPDDPENSSLRVSIYFPGWVYGQSCFWQCLNYPTLPWQGLSAEERSNILLFFGNPARTPIIRDVLMLKGEGILDAFVQQANDELSEFNQRLDNPNAFVFPRGVRPAFASDPLSFIKHMVLTINYMHGVDAVKKQIACWLDSEANKKLFQRYYKKPVHKHNLDSPAHYKELLKDIAAWRLYSELGFKKAAQWTKANRRRRTDALRLRPFFREKPSKGLNVSPLYRDRRDWKAAIRRAELFLKTEFFETLKGNAEDARRRKRYREALAALNGGMG